MSNVECLVVPTDYKQTDEIFIYHLSGEDTLGYHNEMKSVTIN